MPVEYSKVLKENGNKIESAHGRPSLLRSQTSNLDSGLGIEPTFAPPPGEYEVKRRESSGGLKKVEAVGFWHEELVPVRFHVLKLWARTTLILAVAILGILSLYWGALFHTEENIGSLGVWVVDFDAQMAPYLDIAPTVGPAITTVVETILGSTHPHLGFRLHGPSDFEYDSMKVREAVYDFKAWGAIIISANATALLQQAIENGNSSYDPFGAVQVITVSARDVTTVSTYITPGIISLEKKIASSFGKSWTRAVMQNTSVSRQNLALAPQALSPAIGFTYIDLRPFGPPVATPAVSVGLIYLIIIAFFSFAFFLPIHMKYLSPVGHPPLHFKQLILWRWVATTSAYFVLSLSYSLVSLAFQVPFNGRAASHVEPASTNSYSHVTFFIYWMINFIGMNAVGLACENVAMFLGAPWTALWLIFWVITNVATAFYALELAPGFYGWGHAWPLHNIVEATRSTIFDLHSRIGLNLGILILWWAVNTVVFPIACYFMRWKNARDQKLAQPKREEWIKKIDTRVAR